MLKWQNFVKPVGELKSGMGGKGNVNGTFGVDERGVGAEIAGESFGF